MLTRKDILLIVITVVVVFLDILLASCLRLVLPRHLTQTGYYPADKRKLLLKDAVKICPCIARAFPQGTKKRIMFATVEPRATRTRRSTHQTNAYPFLVSLTIPAYVDDPNQKIFACNGLIQSSSSLITTKICVEDETEWFNLTVRSGSIYWSHLGQEHSVVNFTHVGGDLVVVGVSPPFPEEMVPSPPLEYPFLGDWIHAVSLGWDDRMYKKRVGLRFKYRPYGVEEWTSRYCQGTESGVCFGKKGCDVSSKALVTGCHKVVAMAFQDGCGGFSGLGVGLKNVSVERKMDNEGCYGIYRDYCTLNQMEIC